MSDGHHTRSHAANLSAAAQRAMAEIDAAERDLDKWSVKSRKVSSTTHATPDCPCCAAGGCPSCDACHHAGERSHDFTGPGHSITRPTPDRVTEPVKDASYWAGYERGRARAEQSALMMLAWIVEDAGGEITVTPKLTLRRVERIDNPTTDEFTLRVRDD